MLNSISGYGCTDTELTDDKVIPCRTSDVSAVPAVRIIAGAATRAIADLNEAFNELAACRPVLDGSIMDHC